MINIGAIFGMDRAPLPKRRKAKPAIPPNVQKAMADYAKQYRLVYKREPKLSYLAPYITINDADGVNVKRLKQLTAQLSMQGKSK